MPPSGARAGRVQSRRNIAETNRANPGMDVNCSPLRDHRAIHREHGGGGPCNRTVLGTVGKHTTKPDGYLFAATIRGEIDMRQRDRAVPWYLTPPSVGLVARPYGRCWPFHFRQQVREAP